MIFLFLFSIVSCDILVLSDIHLDPFYDSNTKPDKFCDKYEDITVEDGDFGQIGCNTNSNLFEAMMELSKQRVKNPSLIILGGDTLGHSVTHPSTPLTMEQRKEYQIKILSTVKSAIKAYFPGIPVLNVAGNNDGIYHYKITDQAKFKEDLNVRITHSNLIESIEKHPSQFNKDVLKTVSKGFYYSFTHENTVFIVLNTVPMAVENKDRPEFVDQLIDDEFSFLEKELSKAKSAVIMSHIPFSDSFWMEKSIPSLEKPYLDRFYSIVALFESKIKQIVGFHEHIFMAKYVKTPKRKVPYVLLPSFSMTNKNNPSISVVKEDPLFRDIVFYSLSFNEDNKVVASETRALSDLTLEGYNALVESTEFNHAYFDLIYLSQRGHTLFYKQNTKNDMKKFVSTNILGK